jgi:trans-aconitate methyltransferase
MSLVKEQTKYWATRDLGTIHAYWESTPAILRGKWFAEQLKNLQFDSVFEVGFFSGRNLKCIQEIFPDAALNGLEVNRRAVDFAKIKIPTANLLHQDLHEMHNLTQKFDVVFTSAVLIHIPPDEIQNVIFKCLDLSQKYVLHLESVGRSEVAIGPKQLNPTLKISEQLQWNVNILNIYRELGFKPQIIKFPDAYKNNGVSELVIVNKNE